MTTLLDRVPAVRRIDTNRDDAHAFELAGEISVADAENLYGLLEGAYALHPQIDLLLRFVDYGGIDWEAVFSQTAAKGSTHAGAHIRKAAIIGGPDWIVTAAGFLAAFSALELRHFSPDGEDEAWRWIDAAPETSG